MRLSGNLVKQNRHVRLDLLFSYMLELDMRRKTVYFVYRQYDRTGKPLYFGCTSMPKVRFAAHRSQSPWYRRIAKVRMESYFSKAEAYLAEREAILQEQPCYNVFDRTDKRAKKERFQQLRADGWTLQRIGDDEEPKITRQRVFQILTDEDFRISFGDLRSRRNRWKAKARNGRRKAM